FTSVTPAAPSAPDTERLRGLTLPGFANAHSHAFHRALRGTTQADRGTFWTWRERMYQVAGRLDPDSYLALARAVYAEMALAGITCVGEFHYVHHQPDGKPYADPNAMGRALIQAAAEAGLRITLLDTCYLTGGLDQNGVLPLAGPQVRFSDGDGSRWADRAEALGPDGRGLLAPHAPARPLAAAGCTLTLGSDSHAVIDILEEARGVEYAERLARRSRGHFTAETLLQAATTAGHTSLGWPDAGQITPGARADLVTVSL